MKNGKYRKAATFCLSGCPLREEKSFSQRAFSIYTDIRKLQDKAKTSYTLITEEGAMTQKPTVRLTHSPFACVTLLKQ